MEENSDVDYRSSTDRYFENIDRILDRINRRRKHYDDQANLLIVGSVVCFALLILLSRI